MSALVTNMVKATFLFGFLTCVLLVLTYLAIRNHHNGNNILHSTSKRFEEALNERVEEWRKKSRRRNSVNIRHRLVNDLGVVVADEQPDFNQINSVSSYNNYQDGDEKKKKNNSSNDKNETKTVVTVLSSIIEHDPTIDENVVPVSYKYYADSIERFVHFYNKTYNNAFLTTWPN